MCVCLAQAILMASQLRSLETLASDFSAALGKKVGSCTCFCDASWNVRHIARWLA